MDDLTPLDTHNSLLDKDRKTLASAMASMARRKEQHERSGSSDALIDPQDARLPSPPPPAPAMRAYRTTYGALAPMRPGNGQITVQRSRDVLESRQPTLPDLRPAFGATCYAEPPPRNY